MTKKIKTMQIGLLFLAILPITKFIILPSALATITSINSYIIVGIYAVLDFFTLLCILHCYKKHPSFSFHDILSKSLGNTVAKVIIINYFIFFMFKTIAPIIEIKTMISGGIYENIPKVSTMIPFFILAGYASYRGLTSIGRNASLFGVISVISIIILLILSIGNADFSNILPFDLTLTTTAKGVHSGLMWFGDFTIMLIFLGKVQSKTNSRKPIIICYIIAQILVLAFYLILISIYGEITERQINAITKISNFNTALSNLGRYDYVFIVFLLLCFMLYCITTFYASSECMLDILSSKNRVIKIISLSALYIVSVLILQNNLSFIYNFFYKFYGYVVYILQYIIPISLPLLLKIAIKNHDKALAKTKEEENNNDLGGAENEETIQ